MRIGAKPPGGRISRSDLLLKRAVCRRPEGSDVSGGAGLSGSGLVGGTSGGRPPLSASTRNLLFKETLKTEVVKAVRLAFPSLEISDEVLRGLKIDIPKEKEHGEYAIVMFPLARVLRQAPPVIAQRVKEKLSESDEFAKYFEASVIGPYVNIKFSSAFLLGGIQSIDGNFGKNDRLAGQRILVEFVSANPTGPLHIGHGRWAVLGDSMCRLLAACGAKVTREFYINDAGAQIDRYLRSVAAAQKGEPIPEDGYKGDYIREIAGQKGDPVQLMVDQQRQTLASIGVKFDIWFSEKTLYEQRKVEEVLALLERAGLTYRAVGKEVEEGDPNADKIQSSGEEALWFRSTNYGDEKDRVLVRGDGRPTYITGDAAYHLDKIQRGYDLLINIFGADHHGYVSRLSAIIQALSGGAQKHQIIIGQLVKLVRGGEEVKMSKRKGTAIMLHDLIEEIGPDAVRVFMGAASFDTAVNIDLDVATSQTDENPVYYVHYAHARISQILRKAASKGMTSAAVPADYPLTGEERELLVQLFRFPDFVYDSAQHRSASAILRYTIELAALFHSFYAKHKVVDQEQMKTSAVRLAMVGAVQQTLKNAFSLLGISAPDEMTRE